MDQKSCFKLKGSTFTLTVLQLINKDLDCLKKELAIKVEMMPNFFNNTPVVIDLHELAENQTDINFNYLKEILCHFRMIPVGIKGSIEVQKSAIEDAGLAILAEAKHINKESLSVNIDEPASNIKKTTESVADNISREIKINAASKLTPDTEHNKTIINEKAVLVKQTVRSGQQISAPDGDLIIIGSVSVGAEILAAGNIHIYGTLRGRALAGIKGDLNAGIFCHNLQAELISIAGIYLLCDDIPFENRGNSTHIHLTEEKLIFNSI